MDSTISQVALISSVLKRAYIAFIKKAGAKSHGLYHNSPAAIIFETEYTRLEAEASQFAQVTRLPRRRFDAAQTGAV